MKILGTGLSGLVGSRIVELMEPNVHFVNYSLENGVDITNREDITERILRETDAKWMFHFAAFTDVQKAESQKSLNQNSAAWKVNVTATQHIIDAARTTGMKVVYIDTDYAFDGTKSEYVEHDTPNPQSYYAITKYEGAKIVLAHGGLVLRISNPFRAHPTGKKDFVHKMLEVLHAKKELVAPTNQLFVPTFIDDLAHALEKLVEINATGVYHVVGSQPVSPFDAAHIIAKTYGLDDSLIKPTMFAEYFAGRAPVPQYAVLKNDKIQLMGVTMHSFEDGIAQIKLQEYPS